METCGELLVSFLAANNTKGGIERSVFKAKVDGFGFGAVNDCMVINSLDW